MKIAILLLLVLSLSFAGEVWKVDTGAGIGTQPLVHGARIIVGTNGGKVYSIEPPFVKWSYDVVDPVVSDPVSLGGHILIATEGKVIALDQYGTLQWEIALPGIRGVAAADKIYVADDNGIQAINSDGTLAWNFVPGTEDSETVPKQIQYSVTAPLATPNYVIFGYDDYIYSIRTTGVFFWKTEVGHAWDTPPTLVANTLYVGTGEGILYALDMLDGHEKQKINLFEQISTTPVEGTGTVMVGTSNNKVYAISSDGVEWSTGVDGKVSHKMYPSPSGDALYLTTTRSLYAVDPSDGTILFKRSFLDWPSPPAFFNSNIIVGSEDGALYGIDSSKACSILYPELDEQVGDAELTVSGLSYSKYGTPSTDLRINGEEWISLNGTEWSYDMDTSTYEYGVMEIECRVSDSSGAEKEPYTKISLVHIQGITEQILTLTYPSAVKAETEFEIEVLDSRGLPVAGVKITAGGQSFEGDGTVTLSLPPGLQTVKVERPGYASEEFTIDSKGDPTLAYVTGGLFLILLIVYVYFLFIRKEKKKELIIKEKH
ncbi:MAG: PQQ-binding-like beta-propeller repeat protein [bacterium]|nr:PQQ-binding-like beta-propeller repeat protein [bacterium]